MGSNRTVKAPRETAKLRLDRHELASLLLLSARKGGLMADPVWTSVVNLLSRQIASIAHGELYAKS